MDSKKQTIKFKTKHNQPETKETYQFKVTNYQNLKTQKTNKIYNIIIIKTHSNTTTNKTQHKYYKIILNTIQKIHEKKINTILNNTPIKTQITNIQTKTKTKPLTKYIKKNHQTNTTTINKHTKYHQRTPYTTDSGRMLTLTYNITASASRPRHKTKNKYQLTNNWTPNTITNQHNQKQNQYTFQHQHQYRIQHQKAITKSFSIIMVKIQSIIPKQGLQHKTGSASRPRHRTRNIYLFTNNWAPRKITNHTPRNNSNTHFSTKQLTNKIPALPNLLTTIKFTLTKYLKLNKRKTKTIQTHGYYFINKLALLQCGDIEPNPGPMPNILRTHPTSHKKRAKTYFIPNTIKLQPEYQHIASSFAPILETIHPLHHQTNTKYPYLHRYIQTQNHSPSTHILYALIITINPSIDTCNNILAQPHTYDFTIFGPHTNH